MKSKGAWIVVIFCAVLLACGCGQTDEGGSEDTDDDEDDDSGDDDSSADLKLFEVIPSSGGCSVCSHVTLSGEGFARGLVVYVGKYQINEVAVLSETEAEADFPALPMNERGVKDVRIFLGDQTAELENGFEYVFDEDPVVMVHGFDGDDTDFNRMIERFIELGYPESHLAAIDFADNVGSNVPHARDELGPFVEEVLSRTGADKVDIVAHSMGAISSRLWIKLYGGEDKVRDYVSLSGANHGTFWSCGALWWGEGLREMCPVYANQEQSINGVQWTLNGDPDSNDVDETPFGVEDGGEIHWVGSLYSDADIVIILPSSGCLNQNSRDDCTDPINIPVHGVLHNLMVRDAEVFDMVQNLLRQHNSSKP